MQEIFYIAQNMHKNIGDCKEVNDGSESDHIDVPIKLVITSIKLKHNAVIKVVTDLKNIVTDEGYAD